MPGKVFAQPMMSVVTSPSSLFSPVLGEEMPCQLPPTEDQVVNIVLVGGVGPSLNHHEEVAVEEALPVAPHSSVAAPQ
jgi:hypothetical protein